ncbi:MAG: alginate lyase, partial [Mucilaginibacter sp.]|nr:alginate lyase [Mucilaginibacter sp.]
MKKTGLLIIMLICVLSVKAQFVSLNETELGKLQHLVATDPSAKMRFAELQKTADAALNDTPNPIDTIHSEGRLQGDPKKIATGLSLKDMRKMYALALIYRVSHDKKYLDKAIAYL